MPPWPTRTADAVIAEFAGQQFSGFKNALADLTVAKLAPIADEMRRLLADPAEIDRILKAGADRARAIATPIMDEVKKRVVGFDAADDEERSRHRRGASGWGAPSPWTWPRRGWNVALHYNGSERRSERDRAEAARAGRQGRDS